MWEKHWGSEQNLPTTGMVEYPSSSKCRDRVRTLSLPEIGASYRLYPVSLTLGEQALEPLDALLSSPGLRKQSKPRL